MNLTLVLEILMKGFIFPTWVMVILIVGMIIKIGEQFSVSIKMMYEPENKWKERVFGQSYKLKMTAGSYIIMFAVIGILIADWEMLTKWGRILFFFFSFALPVIVAFLTRCLIALFLYAGHAPWKICKWLQKNSTEAAL